MLQERLRETRKRAGLTQKMLAERLGVSRQTISKWEYGLAVPDADQLIQLADILNVDILYFLEKSEASFSFSREQSRTAENAEKEAAVSGFNRTGGDMSEETGDYFHLQSEKENYWKNIAHELEHYNFLYAERLRVFKNFVCWFLILLVLTSVLILSYQLYRMHFYAIQNVEIHPVVTDPDGIQDTVSGSWDYE